ncbi:MAG: hypothetical protein AAGU19_03545 [Prolixibacteraceae bacterium]
MSLKFKHISPFLDRLLESATFSKSPVNRELLKYLVMASLQDGSPKEYQIAAEVFGRKIGQEKETNVRVYMLNLRKKLQEYYQYEGKDEELRFELPKGDYHVLFKYSRLKSAKKQLYSKAPLLLILSSLILTVAVIVSVGRTTRKTKIDFWKPFLTSDYPVFLVLGDHYFFKSIIATGKIATVRDNQINSDVDYEQFLAENPSKADEMEKSKLTYINNQAPIGLFHIMNILGGGTAIRMDYSSRIRMDEFRGHHMIFIGSFKTLRILAPAVEKMGLHYHIENSLLEYRTNDSIFRFDNRDDDYLHYEYAGLIHFVTNDGRHVIFLLCDNDIGNIALVKYLTGSESIRPLEKAVKKTGSENFKGIFEVKGQQRTDFEIRLVRLDPMPAGTAEIWP